MNRTKIEWVRNQDGSPGYTINPVKGLCPMACPYCYARRMYKRFKWNPEIRYDDWVWQEGCHIPKGSKVFVGSTMELFGDWIKPEWLETVFAYCRSVPSITFIFLTKQPQNLIKWSPFPGNCWIGVSATDVEIFIRGCSWLRDIKATIKFISLEPFLEWSFAWSGEDLQRSLSAINWFIIGQQTPPSKKTQPKIEWLLEIIGAADKAQIPIFLKNNLRPLIADSKLSATEALPFYDSQTCDLRQEFPCKKSN